MRRSFLFPSLIALSVLFVGNPAPDLASGLGLGSTGGLTAILSPAPLAAQEVRVTGSRAFPGISALGGSWGRGVGVRWLRGGGIGLALEYDAFRGSTRIQAPVCPAQGPGESGGEGECVVERVDFDSEMDHLTLALLLPLVESDEWRLRLGVGRSAGTMSGTGVSAEGEVVSPPSADREGSLLSWNRGADGTVFWLEVHRDIPGPVPVRAMGTYRFQQLELDGCRAGDFSPFCGRSGGSELHLGLSAYWPR